MEMKLVSLVSFGIKMEVCTGQVPLEGGVHEPGVVEVGVGADSRGR